MIIMKNYIEIINKNENEKPIKVYKGNFTFVHKYDEKLFIECLEGEKYINQVAFSGAEDFLRDLQQLQKVTGVLEMKERIM